MLKQLTILLFTLCLLLQHFSRVLVFADFNLNLNSIIQNLCSNKNKPQMHCKGKCYLLKKLKEEQKQHEAPTSDSKKPLPEMQFFFFSTKSIASSFIKNKILSVYFSYNELQTVSLSNSVFHPPAI